MADFPILFSMNYLSHASNSRQEARRGASACEKKGFFAAFAEQQHLSQSQSAELQKNLIAMICKHYHMTHIRYIFILRFIDCLFKYDSVISVALALYGKNA